MSIADQQGDTTNLPKNPCKIFIKYKNGGFEYYDKEKKESVTIGKTIEFLEMIELTTVTGFDATNECGIYSNEVMNQQTDILCARSFKGGEIATGLWENIKSEVTAAGGKYCKSVYILWNGELANLQVSGAGFGVADKKVEGGWFGRDQSKISFKVSSFAEGKKGSVKFKIPIFEGIVSDDKENNIATKVYLEVLKPYLDIYLSTKSKELSGLNSSPVDLPEPPEPIESPESPESLESPESPAELPNF